MKLHVELGVGEKRSARKDWLTDPFGSWAALSAEMPMKPERQNPFWPEVPRARRAAPSLIAVGVIVALFMVAAIILARIFEAD
ncbi:hypothetical protein [Brevundimonas sp. NIBR10]|uniref:hypothetical protein n=1 Tax=Brevundimonas sp. NIBR10 TaxID=3015997 RepID=UPI0022F14E19|nr:hypothetical protein [Brevundimonas sp. NIBR10]